LLFGLLALQMDFIDRGALVAAMSAWVLDKGRPLGEILQEQGALAWDERAALDTLVDRHLRRHGCDPERSLAAVGSISAVGSVREQLRRLTDPDLDASLAHAGTDSTPGYLGGPADGTPDRVSDDDTPLCSSVRYRVLRPHARGGLGEVHVAEDKELNREVAFKEIQRRYAHDPASRGRFLREAEINGRLEHPGVVPVYGLGNYRDGRPFYAMRLIRGESLKEALDRFHKADVPGRDAGERGLALRQLLGQFVAVCNAVAYAHSQGVLHRDLKPSNVMLGKFGETLVVDWGLAKVLGRPEGEAEGEEMALRPSSGDGSETAAGTAVGTPAYMSPEQASGRLDLLGPASDVYGLGATFYALLTGEAPFKGEAPAELVRRVSRGEWMPPRQVKRGVPPALDAICRKAMALKPEDRYATALELAADVEHWLADEPVTAYREPLLRRLGRWRRRHPALAAGVAVLLLAALAAGVWLKRERDAVERDVRAALQEVERLQEQGKWADAKAALERARGRLAGGGPGDLRRRVRLAEADLDMVAKLEEIRLRQTEVKDGRFNLEAADPAYAAAFQRYGVEALAPDPRQAAATIAASAIRQQLIVALDHWVTARPKKDAQGARHLLALARLADRDPWRQRLRDLLVREDRQALKDLAKEPGTLAQPPVTAQILAVSLWRAGAQAEAVALLREAQQRSRGDFWLNHNLGSYLQVSEPSRKEEALGFLRAAVAVRPQSPGGLLSLGVALERQGRHKEAESAFRRAIALDGDYASAHGNLGVALLAQGRHKEAEAACRKATALKEDDPVAHDTLGVALVAQGRYQEAEAACRRAIGLEPDHAQAHANLGSILLLRGRPKEAAAAYGRAIVLKDDLPEAHCNMGRVLNQLGRYREAEAACRRAIALTDHSPDAHFNLGVSLAGQGRHKEAEAACRQAIALRPDYPEAHAILGATLVAQGRPKEAEAACRRAIALKPDYPHAHANLAGALIGQRRYKEAEAACRRAIALDTELHEAHSNLGAALGGQGRHEEAEAAYRQALKRKPDDALIHYNLGNALLSQGRHADAEAAFRRAIALKEDFPQAHYRLGNALAAQARHAEAEAAFRRAVALKENHSEGHSDLGDALQAQGRHREAETAFRQALKGRPDDSLIHYKLGNALLSQGRHKEAEAAFRRAIALKEDFPEAHCNLGHALQRQGEFASAVSSFRRGHELGAMNPRWPYPSALWVEQAERLRRLDHRLLAVLKGEAQPADIRERLALAQLALQPYKRLYAASARLYAEAFRSHPELAENLEAANRYQAALAAVLAAAGKGEDAAKLDAEARGWLRRQALTWLRADLGAWSDRVKKGTQPGRAVAVKVLRGWQASPEVAAVRDPAALGKLPEAEQAEWQRLWADVQALLEKADGEGTSAK
jgi:tetratricopeptide (TPR) repeat protein/tRNA A-37 threonylcarbamoyl transferase component Bud32